MKTILRVTDQQVQMMLLKANLTGDTKAFNKQKLTFVHHGRLCFMCTYQYTR